MKRPTCRADGTPHAPPYDAELAQGVRRLGYHEGGSFGVSEFSQGNAIYIVWLVSVAGIGWGGKMEGTFEIGDRVQARTSWPVGAGALGRVIQILISAPDMYFVEFDAFDYPLVMRADELELVTGAAVASDARSVKQSPAENDGASLRAGCVGARPYLNR